MPPVTRHGAENGDVGLAGDQGKEAEGVDGDEVAAGSGDPSTEQNSSTEHEAQHDGQDARAGSSQGGGDDEDEEEEDDGEDESI